MEKQRKRNESLPKRLDKDSRAILERRRFLIQSALVGLGAGALAASCKQEPQVCLSVVAPPPKTQTGAQPCLAPMPPKASTPTPATKATPGQPQPCLSPAVPPNPQPCLKIAPQTKTP